MSYSQLVAEHGLAASHRLIAEEVPAGARVLDVGCAGGYLAAQLAARGCEVAGVEADPAAAAAARALCAAVVEGDVESEGVRAALREQAPFGAIVCGDVLEHLRDPAGTLAFLVTLLEPGGRAIVSLPNIAHWTGRRALLRGRFPYAGHGLFDRTHLRFFTRASARTVVEDAGLRVVRERFAPAPLPLQAHVRALTRLEPAAARAWPELFALQFVLAGERA
ncbi:MAG TPA: class I SAM-dependent methyltransferase [Solirubrobacteraceae bacterium]|nr:class I SAM-dependent methyltransferase [Solirubrobacteraceae bacterium]